MAAGRLRQTANAVPAAYGEGRDSLESSLIARFSFPVRVKKFPVRMHRELANKGLICLVFFRVDLDGAAIARV